MKCLRITSIVVILLFSQRFNNIFTFSCHFSLVFFQKRLITSGKVAQCEIFPDTFSLCCVKFFCKIGVVSFDISSVPKRGGSLRLISRFGQRGINLE